MDLFSDAASSQGSSSRRSRSPSVDIVEQNGSDGFRVNEEYAARFQHNKEREEQQRLENIVDDGVSSESSDDETEDEDGEQMTADVDAAILSTLAKIRRKDESIYQAGKRVFDEERQTAAKSKLLPRKLIGSETSSGKKVTLAHYQRARIQELLKTSDDPAKALADATMIERRSDAAPGGEEATALPHSEEQDKLRKEVTQAFHSMADEEGQEDDFFTQKAKDARDDEVDWMHDDPESYKRYLVDVLGGKETELRDILRAQTREAAASDFAPKAVVEQAQKAGISMHAPDGEKDNEDFLVNYVLNRGWVDNPNAAPKMSRHAAAEEQYDDEDAMSDDSFVSRAEAFETAYNFRFQEMEDGGVNPQIQSYARQIEGSVRRKESKRKEEREERARRKKEEKQHKRSELDRLRDLKRKSIVDRLKTLKEATGSSAVSFDKLDLDAEFDPDEHDRLMAEAFNDDYYGEGGEDDGVKPQWSDDDDVDIGDILREHEDAVSHERPTKSKKKSKKSAGEAHTSSTFVTADGERIDMDAGGQDEADEPGAGRPLTKAEKKKAKKREKAKARKAQDGGVANDGDGDAAVDIDDMDADAQQDAPRAKETLSADDVKSMSKVERKQKMESMMNEYYGLEYEDMIGDQPTRFKYTEVGKSNFGLSPVEILLADDTELNKIVGLRRLQPYRQGNGKKAPADLKMRLKEFRRDFYRGDRKAMAEAMGQTDGGVGEASEVVKPKKAGKRERERKKAAAAAAAAAAASSGATESSAAAEEANTTSKHAAKEKKKRRHEDDDATSVETSKKTKKSKKAKDTAVADVAV